MRQIGMLHRWGGRSQATGYRHMDGVTWFGGDRGVMWQEGCMRRRARACIEALRLGRSKSAM